MTSQPALSILLPTYNASGYLLRTIESIRSQDGDFELIIVDDASTDETAEAVRPFLSDRIRYVRQSRNSGGPSKPRNAGLRIARGEIIALCDTDDLILPGKYTRALEVFKRLPDVDFLFTDCSVIDADDRVMRPRFLEGYREFRKTLRPTALTDVYAIRGAEAFPELIRSDFIATSGVVFRRTLTDEIGGFDEELIFSETVDFWLRVARAGKTLAFMDRVDHQYRQRPGNQTSFGIRNSPYVIATLERQWIYAALTPSSASLLRDALSELLIGYGWGLRLAGQPAAAQTMFRKSLSYRLSWSALRGLTWATIERIGSRGTHPVNRQ